MEQILTNMGFEINQFVFISGIAIILLTTIIMFLLTRDKDDKTEQSSTLIEPSIQPEEISEEYTSPEPEESEVLSEIEEDTHTEAEITAKTGIIDEVHEHIELSQEQTEIQEIKKPEKLEEMPEPVEELGIQPGKETPIMDEEIREENFFARLRSGLSKTHTGLIGKLDVILKGKEISDDTWDEFEETLVTSDLGVSTTMKLRQEIEKQIEKKSSTDPAEIKKSLKSTILTILKNAEGEVKTANIKPFVIMVAGVNGVGKTTTIGKLAYKFKEEGKKVMVAAADTFRAAAVDQLEIWSNRVSSEFIKGQMGSDPSAVAYDAVKAAISRNMDILIIDTAGRLHTRSNLMEELKKLRKVVGRELEGAPHETILVLDATTGQNAVQQAKLFDEALKLTGIALTKLDGTAKGGVIVSIANELKIPVKYIGIGESLKDLRDFNAEEFVEALFLSESDTIH